jgi:hypothetical protein
VERGASPHKSLKADAPGNLLRFRTVELRAVTKLTLRVPTFLFLEKADILTTIEGLFWQTVRAIRRGLLWQAGLYKHLQNLPKKYPFASRLAS